MVADSAASFPRCCDCSWRRQQPSSQQGEYQSRRMALNLLNTLRVPRTQARQQTGRPVANSQPPEEQGGALSGEELFSRSSEQDRPGSRGPRLE